MQNKRTVTKDETLVDFDPKNQMTSWEKLQEKKAMQSGEYGEYLKKLEREEMKMITNKETKRYSELLLEKKYNGLDKEEEKELEELKEKIDRKLDHDETVV